MSEIKKDIKDDYEFARSQFYNLSEKGNEAIDLMMDLARESTAIKQNAEVADKLMKLHKEKKDVETNTQAALPNSMTQNNLYVGSATDLQKMLIQKAKEKETTIEQSNTNQE